MTLTVLYPGPGSSVEEQSLEADIVAVHGLNGDPYGTWSSTPKTTASKSPPFELFPRSFTTQHTKSQRVSWLNDFLPLDLPAARIMTFGYDAKLGSNQQAPFADHAKLLLASLLSVRESFIELQRPIIFIGHSFGGIVVKEALTFAHNDSEFTNIATSTTGVIFFGTPHRGYSLTSLNDILAGLAITIEKHHNTTLKTLQRESDSLARSNSEFWNLSTRYQIVSFYETRSGRLKEPLLVVDKRSAILGAPWEDCVALDADHASMCRFASRQDKSYVACLKNIERILKKHTLAAKKASPGAGHNKHYMVPYKTSSAYIGQEDISKCLAENILPSKATHDASRIFVLYGIGGIGKTQVCLKFAEDHRDKYWGVFWVNGHSEASIQQSFINIAQRFDLIADVPEVRRYLSETAHDWLMIIDNADDPSISLSEYFPISGDGSILINSRNAASRLLATVGSVKLGPMEQDTTIQLLLNAAGKVLDTESLEGTSAAKLSQALDGIPLAIDQIGRYIKVSGSTIEDARQVFEKLRHSGDISEYCWRQVSASVIICFNCIENIGTEESCDALDLLFFLSFISPDGVDAERLFERAWNNERVQERDRKFPEYHLRVLSNPMNLDWQPFRLRGALEILLSYSLVMRRGDENKISTHQTIHSYAHHRLTKHEMARYSSVTASTLAFAAGKDLETTGYVFREALLSHISFFLRDHNDDFAREIGLEDWAESLSSFARAFHDGRQYEKALEIETRAMKLRQRLLGGEHSDTLRSMIRIGRHLLSLGRPQEAGGIYQNVLQLQRKTLGGNHYPVEVEAMTCLANTHILLGRFPEAVSLLEKALSLGPRSSSYAEAEFVTITARYHLAVCYRQLGRYMEAVKLEQEALEWTTKILGANHLTTLTSMNNLAVTYGELGRADEAMWLSRQVLDTSRRVLGDRHPYTVTSMRNLAASCSKLGHYSDAEILFGQALDLAREQVDGYSNMLRAMAGLASVYGSLGRHGEALELGQKCLHLIEKHTTRGDLTLLAAMAELAMSEEKAGQYQNAVELGENMLELTKRELGPEHSISLTMMNGLATSYETIGQQSKAADLRDYVAELKKRNDGRSTATTAVDPTYTDFHEAESNSSDDHSACTEESMSQASSISSTTSYGSIQSDVVTPLIAAFESDLQLVFVYEDAMMVMSREKFIRYNVHCLKAFFTALHATTLEQRHAVRLLGSRKQRQLIAEEVCNKVPVNNTLITHPRETLDVDLMVDRFQLLGNPDGETEITLAEELQVSNDESEGSDQDNPTRSDQIDASDIKAMVNLFTNDNAFAQYKTSLQDFVHRQCSPRILRSVITLGNVHVMGGIIERHFDAIAIDEFEWLQELRSLGYGYYDIAEILMDDKNKSPWICFEQPKQEDVHIVPEYHRENCVHQGGKRSDLAPRLTTVDIENTEDIKKLIGEHCGLAGIAPKSRNVQDWTGLVNILGASNDTALITYDMHGTRYQLVSRVSEALQRFCGVASYLQRRGLCCTSFTVLRRTSTNDDVAIEIRQVNLHLASDLLTVLLLLVHNFESPGLIPRCLPRLKELADEIIDSVCNSENINEGQLDFRDCLDRVALAVQILTLGLYLYSQGHTGAVHPFFLMNPLSNIYLFGTQSVSQLPNALVQVSLCGLTCMAKVTGDRVMVFNSYRIPWFDNGTREFDLLASPEDLADTWDVWRFIADATAPYGEDIYAIEVGEGFISSEGEFYMWNGDAIPKLHWTRRAQPLKNTKPFGLHSKALIGTTTINVSCPVDEDSSWQIAHVTMGTLGTDLSYWERSEAQAGFQGGQYLIAQCNLTWAKRPGTTLKQKHLSNINLPFLESDWGLQISYCTGVARRVSLFHLLADVTPALIEPLLQKPSGWTALSTVHNMIGALKNADFAMWHDALEPELQADVVRIIQYVLLIFHDTGIDRSGENLVAIWPRKNDPLRCFKIPCKSVTSWARILTDSPDCATFAYVTSLCLETEDCKCRKLRDAPWHNKSMILDTAISRFINKGPTTVDLWILWHGECYLISTPEKDFLGTVSTSMTPATLHNPPRLYISPSTIPERFRPRVKSWHALG